MITRPRSGLILAAICMLLVVGCGTTIATGKQIASCAPVSSAEVSKIMATAKRNFLTGGVRNDHMTFRSAAQYPMPTRIQAFGMTRIVVLVVTFWFSNPVSAQLGGVTGWVMFGTNDSVTTIYPLGQDASAGFALPTPNSLSWRTWQARNVPHLLARPSSVPSYTKRIFVPGDRVFEAALECPSIDPRTWGEG